MMLLGDVDELEEEGERTQDSALALEPERGDRGSEGTPRPSRAGVAGKGADPFLLIEEILALLLDEDLAEQVAEEADVGAERGVGRHRVSLEQRRLRPPGSPGVPDRRLRTRRACSRRRAR